MAKVYSCYISSASDGKTTLLSSTPFEITQHDDGYFRIANEDESIVWWVRNPYGIQAAWKTEGS